MTKMKLKKILLAVAGLLIISSIKIVDSYSPGTMTDFWLGLFSGLAFVFIAAYLISFGADLYHTLGKK
jgi:hypothetical protein